MLNKEYLDKWRSYSDQQLIDAWNEACYPDVQDEEISQWAHSLLETFQERGYDTQFALGQKGIVLETFLRIQEGKLVVCNRERYNITFGMEFIRNVERIQGEFFNVTWIIVPKLIINSNTSLV